MMSTAAVVKVMPWGEGQGEFVLINESDFDPAVHKMFEQPKATTKEPNPPAVVGVVQPRVAPATKRR
jgi:hypothetical protein